MKVCQFNVILGNNSFVPNDNFNEYIVIDDSQIGDYKAILNRLVELYNNKANEGVYVNGKIIFLIFDERYRNIANKIIELTGVNGEVKYVYKQNNAIDDSFSVNKVEEHGNDNQEIVDNNKEDSNNQQSSIEKKRKYAYRPDTQVFRKEDFYTGDGGTSRSNSSLSNKNVKVKSLKPNKRSGIVSLPVLIFIISFLLLVASFVLLFILD